MNHEATMAMQLCRILIVGAVSVCFTSCGGSPDADPICQAVAGSPEMGAEFASGFFPSSFSNDYRRCQLSCSPTIGRVESEWYPEQWQAAGEPSLFLRSQDSSKSENYAVRFTWLRTFDHPVFIRIEGRGKAFKLIAKELSGKGGYEPGEIQREIEVPLSAEETLRLQQLLEDQALFHQAPAICDQGLDGSEWIFELVDRNGYHMVKRFSPENGAAREVGLYMLNLTGWKFEKLY
jgi:hypothetical protein